MTIANDLVNASKSLVNRCAELEQELARMRVEQALAQEKANQEKIGATVQAARASASVRNQAMTDLGHAQLANIINRMSDHLEGVIAQRDELLDALKLLETGARRFANGSDNMPTYVLALCVKAKAAIARATEGGAGQ